MFSMIRYFSLQDVMRRELIPLAMAFAIAEVFYKWHSFTFECLGFLATWYALGYIQSLIVEPRR